MKICERPSIELMIERVKRVKKTSNIILATTNKKCDNELVEIAKKQGIDFFRGSEDDVLSRVLLAAQKFSIDIIVSLQGDSILIDPKCVDDAIEFFLRTTLIMFQVHFQILSRSEWKHKFLQGRS